MDYSTTTTGQKNPTTPAAAADASDPRLPLLHLAALGERMAILRDHLATSLSTGSATSTSDLHLISSEIATAAFNIILNGASLLTSTHPLTPPPPPPTPPPPPQPIPAPATDESNDFEIVELDSAELLAEHVHFCEICGKGFRRDANLRMHMRAHGDRYKTLESLSSNRGANTKTLAGGSKPVRFSCPFAGCNRNRCHRRFRPLKSAVCARNHFKRSHCPKMYSCNRCGKKRFSVLADLRSHLKNCGETQWKCSCGTTFSRKDKLFGHLALFEGHMPAIGGGTEVKGNEKVEKEEGNGNGAHVGAEEGGEEEEAFGEDFFDDWMEELGGIGGGNWPATEPGR